ncbi:MAG: hypothetical protein R2830_10740 [Saprospiraceae bacterium]
MPSSLDAGQQLSIYAVVINAGGGIFTTRTSSSSIETGPTC